MTFVSLLTISMATLMANLIGAHAFIAAYFDSSVADIMELQNLIVAVNQAIPYLAAYHASLMYFNLCNSHYSMPFYLELAKIVQCIFIYLQSKEWKASMLMKVEHNNFPWDYNASLLLSEEPDYKNGNLSSILYQLLLSLHAISALSAPVVIGPTVLAPKIMESEASSSEFQESLRITVACKHQQGTEILAPTVPDPVSKRAKLILPPSAVESNRPAGSFLCSVSIPDSASERPEGASMKIIPLALNYQLSLSPHVYHSLTTIDLQFYKPLSCQVLESMKLSMLPVASDSLTKPSAQLHSS
ncbi:uncharacterized protein BT62DRAFT_917119 [Guyanagaster necrorhizus]|uniref:Uncharacterized protein n=1 Tax=Guyanagaster necrorhizus TaxID=856835 RepID=A0A9P7W049_9AGAR|nr:uncharacterized protein BT62DRAFT_917119 [Guyanagaster necrorhizus MCA 3950]KAG7450826.1 hypothetical protein BT62DRAFT_917119 [Guyanagaster necrorhizus MCA 3950]